MRKEIISILSKISTTLSQMRKDNLHIANYTSVPKITARYPDYGNIAAATASAMEIDGYIMNLHRKFIFIKPTNNPEEQCRLCINDEDSIRGWQPNAEDLMSEYWTAISQEEFLSLSKRR